MTEGLIVSRSRRAGSISLDRPKALNSLTLAMVRGFSRALDEFAADPDILAVIVTGEGGRAFCAGGDIRALYDLPPGERRSYSAFWREEYQLNAAIASFPKSYIVFMDGVVMGGGVGLSAHGDRRIVTERTRLAMPETGIGFIPDVGGTWLLTRGGGAGRYLALSGETVGAADAIHLGLADVLIDSADMPELIRLLRKIVSADEISHLLTRYAKPAGAAPLADHEALLRGATACERVEDVVSALVENGSDFARAAALTLSKRSPTSLKLTHELLKRATTADRLETCLVNEFHTACNLLETHDLYEGIRAAVVDKDRKPRWSPATLEAVDDARVLALLDSSKEEEPSFRPRS
jgi:enoyl-CoA hydratase